MIEHDGFGHETPYEGATNDWITPRWIIEAFGEGYFDLDPCASVTQPWPTAKRRFTIEDNGLSRGWPKYCNEWVNPTECSCIVQPNIIYFTHEYKNLQNMLKELARDGRIFQSESGQWRAETANSMQELRERIRQKRDQNKNREMPDMWGEHELQQQKDVHEMLDSQEQTLGESHKKLYEMQNRITNDNSELPLSVKNRVSFFLVQEMRKGICQEQTNGTPKRPSEENKIIRGKEALQSKREGGNPETQTEFNGQPQKTAKKNVYGIRLDDEDVDRMQEYVGQQMRILWSGSTIDSGSLYSIITSELSGDNSREYGSGMLRLQLLFKRQFASGGLDYGQAGICPNCRKIGFAQKHRTNIFLNPPYGPHTHKWVERLAGHRNGVALIFARVETRLWQDFIFPTADGYLFPRKRIQFCRPDGTTPKSSSGAPSALIAWGMGNREKLIELCDSGGIAGAYMDVAFYTGSRSYNQERLAL